MRRRLIRSTRPTRRWGALTSIAVAAAGIACPIQRPSVPAEFYPFRAALEAAVADTAVIVMEGRPAIRERLYSRLPELAAVLTTDSLLRALAADTLLEPVAGPVAAQLDATLRSTETGGRARAAFRNPDGQRQAVDAILIGLGTAVRRLRARSDTPPTPPRREASRTCKRRRCPLHPPGFDTLLPGSNDRRARSLA